MVMVVDGYPSHIKPVGEEKSSSFEQMKASIHLAGTKALATISLFWDRMNFVVFRVLSWMYPRLGIRMENVFLRISNIWKDMKEGNLKEENQTLQSKLKDQESLIQENQTLTQQLAQMKQDRSIDKSDMQQQTKNLEESEEVIKRHRDLLLRQNKKLEKKNKELESEKEATAKLVELLNNSHSELSEKLKAVSNELESLKERENSQQLTLEGMSEIRKSSPANKIRLSNFLTQLKIAKERIEKARQEVDADSSAGIALGSVDRTFHPIIEILKEVGASSTEGCEASSLGKRGKTFFPSLNNAIQY